MDAERKLATYVDLAAIDEDEDHEILAGQLVALPAPRPRHTHVQGVLRWMVGRPFHDDDGYGGPGGWWILLEPEIEFEPHLVLRPDLAGWRRERLLDPDQQPIRIVPDWVCEVISASNPARDRVTKRRLYATHAVAHYWMVDPDARVLEALSLRAGEWVDAGAFDETATARIAPFEAAEIVVGRLFLPRIGKVEG